MELIVEVLRWMDVVVFTALAVTTGRRWLQNKTGVGLWMFLTFADLAVVIVAGRLLPDDSNSAVIRYLETVNVAILLLFPYLLYRIAAAFTRGSRFMDLLATILTGALVVWALIMRRLPGEEEVQPTSFRIFVYAILLQWVLLSTIVAIRFWHGGTDQPAVARRRMRALSIASITMSIAIVVVGTTSGNDSIAIDLAVQLFVLGGALLFFFAFAPPRWLRAVWRRQSEENLRRAVIDLMGAVTDEAVIDGLLPHAASIIGGEGIAILDKDGRPIGTYGITDEQWDTIRTESDRTNSSDGVQTELAQDITKLDFPFGSLVVRTSVYTPFFGRDEIELLGSLGVMANLALERVRASEMRLELAESQLRRAQALEINDNVVQGLAVAKYAIDLGQMEKAQEAVEGTLAAARRIISDLLEEIGEDENIFGPEAFVRDRAATGFTRRDI